MPHTLTMIKPDVTSDPALLRAVEAVIEANDELVVTAKFDERLTAHDVAELFPAFRSDKCPLTTALLSTYLTSNYVRFLVMKGADAISSGRRLRKAVRSRFAKASFSNCLHVAADPAEVRLQLSWLAARTGGTWEIPSGADALPAQHIPGIYGPLLGRTAELQDLAASVWSAARSRGWDGLWSLPLGSGDFTATLISDEVHSIDYVVSALVDLGVLDLRSALFAVLEVDRLNEAHVFSGSRERAQDFTEGLIKLGLSAEVRQVSSSKPGVEVGLGHG